MSENTSKSIFVSHAATDKAIADAVVDLLDTAMGIDVQHAVFCTSLEGLKIPPGMDFKQFIKDQIQHPKIVLLLISQNYLASSFCLAEVGASWAMSHRIIPILIPPAKYDDLKAVLAGIHGLKIDDPNDWNEALEVFKEELTIDPNVNRWERKRNEQLETIKLLIPNQTQPPIVSSARFAEVKAKLSAANQEIAQLESDVKRLKAINSKIRTAKNRDEIARIELESLPDAEKFGKLVDEAASLLKALPSVVGKAIYYNFRGEQLQWPGFGEDDERKEIEDALERELLRDLGERGLELIGSVPKIGRATAALHNLETFIEKEASTEFAEAYMDEHDEPLSFSSRTFWEAHLLR